MLTQTFSSVEQAVHGFSHAFYITYADVVAIGAAASGYQALLTLTESQFVREMAYVLTEDFLSANGTGLTVSGANGSSDTAYMAAKELQGTEIDSWRALSATPPAGAPDQVGETEAFKLKFTTSGGSTPLLSEYTAGKMWVFAKIVDLRKIVPTP